MKESKTVSQTLPHIVTVHLQGVRVFKRDARPINLVPASWEIGNSHEHIQASEKASSKELNVLMLNTEFLQLNCRILTSEKLSTSQKR